jgi:antitoxin FitA
VPKSIALKDIPDDVYQRLVLSAEANFRSLSSEVIACLDSHLLPKRVTAVQQLAAIRGLRESLSPAVFNHDEIDRLKREGRP